MRASVIIRSKDEADRLRLTLRSLSKQIEPAEVVIVNDGSSDHTANVIEEASHWMDIIRLDNKKSLGRSGAANAGAALASGDILIFLDGDTLAGPEFVSRHAEVHRRMPGVVARGETHHLRCTRFFADPETGSPRAGEESRVAALSAAELERMRVTLDHVVERFKFIHDRSQPGVYPGAGPRRLFEIEMEALRKHPGSGVLWAAASGSNQSVSREAFIACGGFNESITINEHRELALRLCNIGVRMVPVDGAFSYHLTHRTGWRDPIADTEWERIFYSVHPIAEVPLLSILWSSFSEPTPFPSQARIASLTELEAAAARCRDIVGIENVRKAHVSAALETVLE
jgi:glycosyltransferase involved in cell wall biosynthesis